MDIFTLVLCSTFTFGMGIYCLKIFGKPDNPLILKSLLIEPFDLYSVVALGTGIFIPFAIQGIIKELRH